MSESRLSKQPKRWLSSNVTTGKTTNKERLPGAAETREDTESHDKDGAHGTLWNLTDPWINSELLLGRSYLNNLVNTLVGRDVEVILFGDRWRHESVTSGQSATLKRMIYA